MAKPEDNKTWKDKETEARRLKSLASKSFTESDIKSATKHAEKAHRLCPKLEGIYGMLTAFKTLSGSEPEPGPCPFIDWYKVLQVEPFSNINKIKKQYKKLAFVLHPDKNNHPGCEEAFKLVTEGFRVLSDEIRRKEYDVRFRIRLQEEMVGEEEESHVETFWTVCSTCRILHQFERKYLEHDLVCPNCRKSFKAVEVDGGDDEEEEEDEDESEEEEEEEVEAVQVGVRSRSERLRVKRAKMGNAEIGDKVVEGKEEWGGVNTRSDGSDGEARKGKSRVGGLKRRISLIDDVSGKSTPRTVIPEEEKMTLAEMQLKMKKKSSKEKAEAEEKEKSRVVEKEKEKEQHGGDTEMEESRASEKSEDDGRMGTRGALKKSRALENEGHDASANSVNLKTKRHKGSRNRDLEKTAAEYLELYDFDEDREERSFKKGQVWALYDDDDGMPRQYCLINEVISVSPFKVKLYQLDPQNYGNERLLSWEERGLNVSCGRFKTSNEKIAKSLSIFSHAMECERAAREAYRIYPKKGSVWAIYIKNTLAVAGGNLSARDKRRYEIVVFLTTFSEAHGLSLGYLEKVDGYKTVFKRREIGLHAVKMLRKDDLWLISHQIPARKLSGDNVPDRLKDCWELDPASIPPNLLAIARDK